MTNIPLESAPPTAPIELDSVFDMVMNGGPLMFPIALCSVIAVTYVVERSVRLRSGHIGSPRDGRVILDTLAAEGPGPALQTCKDHGKPLSRILAAGLQRFGAPFLEVEKAVEDAGQREVKRLSANLRPLIVIGMIAPLLGLLGTVWGMIEAFSSIALQDGLGKPELLASGISQALITTAAGLTIAIPTQAAYYWFKGRIDRFVRRTEDLYLEMQTGLDVHRFARIESGASA